MPTTELVGHLSAVPWPLLVTLAVCSHFLAWWFGLWFGLRCMWKALNWNLVEAHRGLGLNEDAVRRHVTALRNGTRLPAYKDEDPGSDG